MRIDNLGSDFAKSEKKTVITLGNFDGIHQGHQKLFTSLQDKAKKIQGLALVLSFDPHPREYFTGQPIDKLLSLEKRTEKIRQKFPELSFATLRFDHALSQTSVEDFLNYLLQKFRMAALVVGSTTHIGKNREGTPERLKELSKIMGFDLRIIEPVVVDGEIVSSTLIRNWIKQGQVEKVPQVMDAPLQTEGVIKRGQGIGTRLGFSTANLHITSPNMLPHFGVYAGQATIEGKKYPVAIHWGVRPSINQGEPCVEVHIIDEKLDLYGKAIVLDWIAFVRFEATFPDAEALQAQIAKDVTKVKQILKIS